VQDSSLSSEPAPEGEQLGGREIKGGKASRGNCSQKRKHGRRLGGVIEGFNQKLGGGADRQSNNPSTRRQGKGEECRGERKDDYTSEVAKTHLNQGKGQKRPPDE